MSENPEYILEFIPNGRFVRVSAVDPATGVEAIVIGGIRQPQELLAKTAVKKLEYVLSKKIGAAKVP